MSRMELPFSPEHIAAFDSEVFVQEGVRLNQRTSEAVTLPFPKAPDRWLSHYQFRPRWLEFTAEGEVGGGLSWQAEEPHSGV